MKQNTPTKWLLGAVFGMLLLALAVVFTGCAGEPGPAGPAGPAGPPGPEGPAGMASESAGNCADCHNAGTELYAKQVQHAQSLHGGGLTFERNGAACAACHTSEGYASRIDQGADMINLEAAIAVPSPVNCRTCHKIHETNTAADWALTYEAPVKLALGGDTIDLGQGNLCASCHQPRVSEIPSTGSYEITSMRFGPHHGPQSTVLTGKASAFEYKGSNVHAMVPDGCVSCHMAAPYGKQSGDHTWTMAYEYHGSAVPNVAGCTSCHPELEEDETFDRNDLMTDVAALLAEAEAALKAAGVMRDDGYAVTGTFPAELAGAFWDVKTIQEDRSLGIHNPGYTKALLKNAIEVANAQ